MLKLRFVCALLIVGILLSACGSSSAPEPPRTIRFDTDSDMRGFIQAAELSEGEYETYQKENLKRSSPSTKEDAQKFAKMMESVGIPIYAHPERIEEYSYTYYPGENIFVVFYRINGVRYRFSYSDFEEYTNWRFKRVQATYTIDDREVPVYKSENWLASEVYAGGYRIRIVVMDPIDPADLVLSDFSWSREMEYMDQ